MPKARHQKATPPDVNAITSGRGASGGSGSSTGGGDGAGGAAPSGPPPDPTLPPPLPGEISTLHQLLSSNLFSGGGGCGGVGGGGKDIPLLVPLTSGSATNMHFDEAYGEAQEALIERYLQLMGVTGYHQQSQWLTSPSPSPLPTSAPLTRGSYTPQTLPDPSAPPHQPLPFPPVITLSPTLSPGTTRAPTRAASPSPSSAPSGPTIPTTPSPTPVPSALVSLGLDRPSLASRCVPDALINALHRGLASNAAAFFRTCLADQRRLVALAHGSGPNVPLADRVMAFITGVEPQLSAGSAIPDLVDLRTVKDTQAVLDAVRPRSPRVEPFHHELMALRKQKHEHKNQQKQQTQQSKPHQQHAESDAVTPLRLTSTGPPPLEGAAPTEYPPSPPRRKQHPGGGQQQGQGTAAGGEGGAEAMEDAGDDEDLNMEPPLPPGEPDFSHLKDLDKIETLAHAGNVPGLRALLRGLVDALSYTRTALGGRLAEEGARAQREWSRAEELTGAVSKLREQLAARNSMLSERGSELEAACRRASAAEEALVTERAKVEGLRGRLRQLTADFEAQHRQLRTHIAAQASAPVKDSSPLASGVLQEGSVLQPHPTDPQDDTYAPHALAIRLASTRGDLALSEMRAAQEAAGRRQLQVMLQSAQATAELHASRAVEAGEQLEHMRRLREATADLASATTGGLAILEQQLAQEKAAHRRTTERLQASAWKYEQARTAVVDIRSRAAHSLRRLQTAVADTNLRAVTAECSLGEARMEVMNLTDKLERSDNTREALRDRLERVNVMLEEMRQAGAVREVELQAAQEKLKDVQLELRAAEARVAQMQEKVMADADAVMAGKAASRRLEELQKEHEQLLADHTALTATHGTLVYAHHDLCIELEEARERLADLGAKAGKLDELQTAHEALQEVKSRLETQHAALSKANKAMSSELSGLKRHADVLAEQVQESRRVAEEATVSLESEKELHRHTTEELSLITGQRDEFEAKCTDLEAKMEALEIHVASVDEEVERCRRTAQLAGHQRAEAFAMRDAINKVRMLLACDMKEYLSSAEVQTRTLTSLVESLRSASLPLSSRLLDMDAGELADSGARLPTIKYEDAKKLWDSAYRIASHGARLLEMQAETRGAMVERLERLEEGAKERLNTATDYWRQVLVLSRGSPRSMIQMVEHMTGQACKELNLDPVNPLSRMVPLGVLQEAGDQLASQFERVGVLRGSADSSRAQEAAASKLLEHEREVNATRSSEYQSLISSLSSEVVRLRARVGSLEANNTMQQRATADMQRMLNEAEWKVSKCHERETLTGIRYMVPLGRETRATQTIISDLLMTTGGVLYAGGLLPPSAATAYLHPRPTAALPPAADPANGYNEYEEDSTTVEEEVTVAFSSSSQASVPMLPLPLPLPPPPLPTAPPPPPPILVFEPPPSPASLPPLSLCNSPTPSRTQTSSAGGAAGGASGGGAVSRDGRSSPVAVSGPGGASASSTFTSRPPSNLSRSTGALPLGRSVSPDMPVAEVSIGITAPGGMAVGTAAAPPPRRRHPDEVSAQRRSSGSSAQSASISGAITALSSVPAAVPLSPVASLTSLTSSSSVASEAAAAGAPLSAINSGTLPPVGQTISITSPANVSTSANVNVSVSGSFPTNSGIAALAAVAAASAGGSVSPDAYGNAYVSVSGGHGDADGGGGEDDESRPWSAGGTPRTLGRSSPNPASITTAVTAASYSAAASSAASSSSSAAAAQPQSPQTAGPLKSNQLSIPSRPSTAIASLPPSHIHQSTSIRISSSTPSATSTSGTAPAASNSPAGTPASPGTPTGVPHGWQTAPWDWLPEATSLTRGSSLMQFSRQVLLDLLADINATKSLHDAVAAAADYPPTSLRAYVGAYFEARYGPRGSVPPAAALALAQLLLSLQAHSALYEVMLFTRLAGLQEWHAAIKAGPYLYCKGSAHSPSRALSRPSTAMASVTSGAPGSATASPPLAHASVFARPRTSRAVLYSGGGGVGGGGLRATAAANRSLSARAPTSSSAASSSPAGLSLMPSVVRASTSPTIVPTHMDSGDGGDAGGWMTTSLSATLPATAHQQMYGSSPSVSGGGGGHPRHRSASSNQHLIRYGSANGGLTVPSSPLHLLLPPPSAPPPQPPKPQLRLVPEAWIPEQLGAMLRRLGNVGGMEPLAVYVAAGRLSGRLNGAELGQPLPEAQHPQLHFVVQRVVTALGLQELPELLVRDTLPYGTEAMLLQLPCVATSSLEVLSTAPPDRQPAPNVIAAASSPPGGCRRRALLLLSPGLVAAAAGLPPLGWMHGSEGGGVSRWERSSGSGGGGGGGSVDMNDVAAVLGAALAPMAMPGGYGWRLDVQPPGSGSPPSTSNNGPALRAGSSGGVSGATTARPNSPPSPPHTTTSPRGPTVPSVPAPAAPPTLLSAAEVVTVVNVATLRPRAVVGALPSQLQFKWERLLTQLRSVAAAATLAADRGALLATQALRPALESVWRGAAGAGLGEVVAGSGEEMLLQAQALPLSEEELQGVAAMPVHDAANAGGDTRRTYALARVVLLARWAESPEFRHLLRSAIM